MSQLTTPRSVRTRSKTWRGEAHLNGISCCTLQINRDVDLPNGIRNANSVHADLVDSLVDSEEIDQVTAE